MPQKLSDLMGMVHQTARRYSSFLRDMTQALNKPRANVKAMLDDWLAGDTGGLGIIRNASLDTAMHLELGTLPRHR